MNKRFQFSILFFLCSLWLYFAASLALQHDTFFHSDIARDFLVLEQISKTHRPTLLGPQAGGTPGFYHGVLWFYLNLPAFILFHGDPSLVAWWWILLVGGNVGVVYFVARKLTSKRVAVFATFLFALIALSFPLNLFNPYAAVFFFPIFFYFWIRYDQTNDFRFLLAAVFTDGLLIHGQVMFGVPILILAGLAWLNKVRKTKQWSHFFCFFILAIPLLTYLLFDLRHDWLQSRAILDAVLHKKGPHGDPLGLEDYIYRVQLFLTEGFELVSYLFGQKLLTAISSLIGIALTFFAWKKTTGKQKSIVKWFVYFCLGYWAIMFTYSGGIWQYYFWPFITVLVIVVSTLAEKKSRVFYGLYAALILINLYANFTIVTRWNGFVGENSLSWQFYSRLARQTFVEGEQEFGYYIYTPDLYAYQPRYALDFMADRFPQKNAAPYQKRRQTFLIFAPAPGDRPFFNGVAWKRDQVKITKDPVQVIKFPNGYRIEEYHLTDEELKVESDPTMLQGLFFR